MIHGSTRAGIVLGSAGPSFHGIPSPVVFPWSWQRRLFGDCSGQAKRRRWLELLGQSTPMTELSHRATAYQSCQSRPRQCICRSFIGAPASDRHPWFTRMAPFEHGKQAKGFQTHAANAELMQWTYERTVGKLLALLPCRCMLGVDSN
jgi:hypothetical protein